MSNFKGFDDGKPPAVGRRRGRRDPKPTGESLRKSATGLLLEPEQCERQPTQRAGRMRPSPMDDVGKISERPKTKFARRATG